MKRCLIFIILFSICMYAVTFTSCTKEESQHSAPHAFSVSENKQVYFAKSNLQYCPATGKWSFAENAYDCIGQNNENIDATYSGNIDLFAWGATGANGIAPYSTVCDNTIYGSGHNSIANTNMDFGVAISEQLGRGYRMFTHDEIHYMLMFRKNADKLFGYATINDIKGLIILPDDWITPENIIFKSSPEMGFSNQYNWYWTIGDNQNYNYNNYTIAEWNVMEDAGAVFLPATGMRYETEVSHANISGHYWTSSNYGEEFANCLCLFEKDLFLEGNFDRCYGLAVRLVIDAQELLYTK